MNSDNLIDLLIYQSSGARANETFNLFLYRPTSMNYLKVEGFNDWPNMHSTKIPGVVASYILKGVNEYKFFEINSWGELTDLNISEADSYLDGKAYNKGLDKVRRLKKSYRP
ncbi:hypothetical protein LAG90_04875 [Marinilongibacter aquaticus]|uniref:hypothetical protein n=1 Tax=Marinilongibacter aquaticus TaxID=2975157 RepID=UPI0021BD0724|nr:hypothetical protein [Marinilongibacter aquaticus]UBM59982.1 hypothetical protein LAG90_04875 [Marinilongibacter aquaticus]